MLHGVRILPLFAVAIRIAHKIKDIEKILDDVVMIQYGNLRIHGSADDIREQKNMSIDQLFREVFRC